MKILDLLPWRKRETPTESYPVESYPLWYGWRDHSSYSSDEVEDMARYRRQIVMPAMVKVLNAFLNPDYQVDVAYKSIHGDELNIRETYGDCYIVGTIGVRGHSCITNFGFWSSGPRVKCPKCGVISRVEAMERRHECGEIGLGEVDPDLDQRVGDVRNEIRKIHNNWSSIEKMMKDLETAIHRNEG